MALPFHREFRYLIRMARQTGAFKTHEIRILTQDLCDYYYYHDSGHILLKEIRNGVLCGYLIFCKTPLTEFTWDLYWIVVQTEFQNSGVGKILIKKMEEHLHVYPRVLIRVETSGSPAYEKTRHFYAKNGFRQTAKIKDFYNVGDPLIVYTKEIK